MLVFIVGSFGQTPNDATRYCIGKKALSSTGSNTSKSIQTSYQEKGFVNDFDIDKGNVTTKGKMSKRF